MAEPTLKDVLDAIAGTALRLDRIESEMATKAELNAFRSEAKTRFDGIDAFRSEAKTRFDGIDKKLGELDKDLTGHMKVHRELE